MCKNSIPVRIDTEMLEVSEINYDEFTRNGADFLIFEDELIVMNNTITADQIGMIENDNVYNKIICLI